MREQRDVNLEADLHSVRILERNEMLMVLVAALLGDVLAPHPAILDRELPRAIRHVRMDQQVDVAHGTLLERRVGGVCESSSLQQKRIDVVASVQREQLAEAVMERGELKVQDEPHAS